METLTKKKVIKVFSDGSLSFDYTIIKRSKKINFVTKDHKNFFLNQKTINLNMSASSNIENFKTKYI